MRFGIDVGHRGHFVAKSGGGDVSPMWNLAPNFTPSVQRVAQWGEKP